MGFSPFQSKISGTLGDSGRLIVVDTAQSQIARDADLGPGPYTVKFPETSQVAVMVVVPGSQLGLAYQNIWPAGIPRYYGHLPGGVSIRFPVFDWNGANELTARVYFQTRFVNQSNRRLISKQKGGSLGFHVGIDNDGKLYFEVNNSGTIQRVTDESWNTGFDNDWHEVRVNADYQAIRIARDGVLRNTTDTNFNFSLVDDNSAPLTLAGSSDATPDDQPALDGLAEFAFSLDSNRNDLATQPIDDVTLLINAPIDDGPQTAFEGDTVNADVTDQSGNFHHGEFLPVSNAEWRYHSGST